MTENVAEVNAATLAKTTEEALASQDFRNDIYRTVKEISALLLDSARAGYWTLSLYDDDGTKDAFSLCSASTDSAVFREAAAVLRGLGISYDPVARTLSWGPVKEPEGTEDGTTVDSHGNRVPTNRDTGPEAK